MSELKSQTGSYLKPPSEALHSCIRDGNLSKLSQLLASPTGHQDLNYQDGDWGTPLHVATWCDNLDAANALLEAGADPLVVLNDDRGLSPLTLAARDGRRDILQRFWRHVPPKSHANSSRPWGSCLVHASTYGQVSVVAELLDWWDGWSDEVKETALLWAAGRWQVHVVELLLSRFEFGHRAIDQALHKSAGFKFSLYEEERSAVRYEGVDYLNQQQLIALLIGAGAKPDERWHKQHLTLLTSSAVNLVGALKAVLECGADPNATTNDKGQSALHLLASPIQIRDQDTECSLHETGIRLLLKHNGSVIRRDEAGEAPIHWAAFGSNLHIFQLYRTASRLDKEALLELGNHHGETLLHFAAAGGKIDIMEQLLSIGMNVNEPNSNGWTPLMCALAPTGESNSTPKAHVKTLSEAIRAARLLLSHGADTRVTTAEGWNPLHCLAAYGDDDAGGEAAQLARELISHGANVKARAPLIVREHTVSLAKAASRGSAWGYRLREALENAPSKGQSIRFDLTPLGWATEHGAFGVAKALQEHAVDPSSGDRDWS